ncbi:short-chain fatty acid transporter [Roseivirga misakiensis]|uniref:Short chain fatty acid transporter n=1 Tax=Roseivirga misakiensis TaxID=1563681 RepID=A0A1E5T2W3_9BACT|nr:TIGR00366 family protein [Roseivirga misakiensis]OEK05617.1 short chain fatty acid transporter [Roseivirga misakiensis]
MREESLYLKFVKNILPSPFSIAVLLTVLTAVLALMFTSRPENAIYSHPIVILDYWQTGFWELLEFTMQMALILILGHVLALTPLFNKLINRLTLYCDSTAKAAFLVSLVTIFMSFINWGLCLVFGAIFARKVAENAQKNGWNLNYPLIGAAGYAGMMCWHGGFSGSAPLTVSGTDHFLADRIGIIGIEETILSTMNLTTSALLIIIIPIVFYLLGKRTSSTEINLPHYQTDVKTQEKATGGERIDHSKIAAVAFGSVICFLAIRQVYISPKGAGLSFIGLNYINFFLFGLGVLLHGSFNNFLSAIQSAIGGAAGIIIQFPLYAGIMGIMKYSGLGALVSEGFVEISNATTLPIFTLFSAGLVNVFVPSGGGQWAVQGPIITEAAQTLGVSVPKAVMALSYGDQLTNMLQPFWALPLLGITKLKAKDILPYSMIIMGVGLVIFLTMLLAF